MPDLIYNVKFNIDDNLQEGVAGAERYEQQVEELEMQVAELTAQLKNATDQQDRFAQGGKTTGAVVGSTNKQLALSNQLFFSLSDGIQDSAQFSQGFSTGMRAIGNNIGFTAELMGMYITQTAAANKGTASFGAVISGLGRSIFGVGGLILGLNIVVTALTEFSRRAEAAAKKVKELSEETDALTSSISSLIAESIGESEGFADEIFDIGTMQKNLFEVNRLVSEYRELLSVDIRKAIETSIGGQVTDQVVENTMKMFLETGELQDGYINDLTESQQIRLKAFRELIIGLEEEANGFLLQITKTGIALQNQALRNLLGIESEAISERSRIMRQSLDAITSLGETELDLFIQNEERKREEAEKTARFQEYYQTRILGNRMAEVPTQKEIEEATTQIVREEERAKENARRASMQAAISMAMILGDENKALAIAFLAVEKGVRIAEVITKTQAAIAQITAAAGVQLAGGDVSAPIRAGAIISTIKATSAASIAAILAQGIAQAGSLGSGGSALSASGAPEPEQEPQFGFQTQEVEGGQRFRSPMFTPQNGQIQNKIVINQELKANRKDLYILNKLGEEEYRQRQT